LITVGAAGVCNGIKYYDANGIIRTGTKACSSSSAGADVNNNGIVDNADYSFGLEGASLTSAPTLTVGNDGSFFKVVGGGTINAIATSRVGRKIILMFDSQTIMTESAALSLIGKSDFVFAAGDVSEFVDTPVGWKEMSRNSTSECTVTSRTIFWWRLFRECQPSS
jgi:hypothetical protein